MGDPLPLRAKREPCQLPAAEPVSTLPEASIADLSPGTSPLPRPDSNEQPCDAEHEVDRAADVFGLGESPYPQGGEACREDELPDANPARSLDS